MIKRNPHEKTFTYLPETMDVQWAAVHVSVDTASHMLNCSIPHCRKNQWEHRSGVGRHSCLEKCRWGKLHVCTLIATIYVRVRLIT